MPTFLSVLTFPGIDPIALQIGPVAIHWYGIAYIAGILFGWWYAKRLVGNAKLWPGGRAPLTADDLDDFLVWAAVGIVLGGRVGYILFYDLDRYLANPGDILAVWQGGMSFHGGFAGTTLAMILFARRRGIPLWTLFDIVAASVPVAIGLVRLTNFVNSELWGKETMLPWGVIPPGEMFARHPSQIYEALLEGFVLFLVLRVLTHLFRKLDRPGFVAGAFVTGYATARIFVEFFRMPDPQLGYLAGGWLTMGMVLSVPMALVGIWAMATARRSEAARLA